MPATPIARLRKICLALRETHEEVSHGAPTFRVRGRQFAMFADAGTHHGAGRDAVWLKVGLDNQGLMVRGAPGRFFLPPYVASSGYVGIWLDGRADWQELAELVDDAYRLVAPKRLLAALDGDERQ